MSETKIPHADLGIFIAPCALYIAWIGKDQSYLAHGERSISASTVEYETTTGHVHNSGPIVLACKANARGVHFRHAGVCLCSARRHIGQSSAP
jgi:hypothetical protein